MGERAASEPRLSTPLVLAAASGMLAVAFVVYVGMDEPAEPDPMEAAAVDELHVDDSTPETAAQSFYDAWRRRRWEAAGELSVGAAQDEVQQKQAADEAMPRDERIVAERTWDALARAPLTLALEQVDILGGGRFHLAGTAEYLFVGQPYRRRVEFDVVREGEAFRVERMELGEVLTELPDLFKAEPREAP